MARQIDCPILQESACLLAAHVRLQRSQVEPAMMATVRGDVYETTRSYRSWSGRAEPGQLCVAIRSAKQDGWSQLQMDGRTLIGMGWVQASERDGALPEMAARVLLMVLKGSAQHGLSTPRMAESTQIITYGSAKASPRLAVKAMADRPGKPCPEGWRWRSAKDDDDYTLGTHD